MRQRELGNGLSINNRLNDPGREHGEAKDSAYIARVQPGFPGNLLFGVNPRRRFCGAILRRGQSLSSNDGFG
jgi:hypothetical protein